LNLFSNLFSTAADVTNYEEIDHAIQRCEIETGPIDVLINCAGYAYPSKLEDIPLEHIKVTG